MCARAVSGRRPSRAEPARGLVEQQHIARRQQLAQQVYAAPLTLGERVYVRQQQLVRAQNLHQLRHTLGRHTNCR